MAIVRYDPFRSLSQIQRDINQLFDRSAGDTAEDGGTYASDWSPAVDVKEESNRFVIHADVPGVKPEDIEVTMDQGILTIKGRRESETKEETERYSRVERVRGTFLRRFTLPDTADDEKISANTKDGVLEVVIPKGEKAQPKKIKVQG